MKSIKGKAIKMKSIFLFLNIFLCCSSQENTKPLIVGDWWGLEKKIVYEVYKNDSLAFYNEKMA
ncbi:MAG: hypothetical protein AAGA66_15250, partial [Bacteroidota bacterium]